jgi:uncharacterized RDD family membrane protein YckC
MSAMDEYVRQVMEFVPPAAPERARIEIDLRSHVEETVAGEGTLGAAAQRIGAPAEVARGYLADVPLSPASIGKRVLAFLLDVLVGLAVFAIVGLLLSINLIGFAAAFGGEEWNSALGGFSVVAIVLMILTVSLLSLLYFPLLEWRFGQTVGKRALGIHVVNEDGTAVGLGAAIVRRIPFFLEFFWIDAIVALFTERQQRAFDLVARTVVVDVGDAPSVATSGLPVAPAVQ